MLKKLLVPLFGALLAITAINGKRNVTPSYALENSGNGFELIEKSYTASESFVYTAVANFENGQACGVVIGGADDSRYWVFNIDRFENKTKLLYFGRTGQEMEVTEVRNEWYMGNDKVTESELNVIKPKVAACPQYNFKVVVTIQESHAYAEFFIDNIKRFGVDETIDLNNVISGVSYGGGHIGFNVFNAKVNFTDVNYGKSDYAYYTEPYRNQYHYSQYAHWNNDPNGLVYYDGWYHMYYQTHPYSQYWDHMYWGHARSRDLLHWQELPYALFPDDGNMGVGLEVGYAWSGLAMVYRPGMSAAIDEKNWFPHGNGTGLLGYYTRDGQRQDQVIITSDDGGMTWVKRQLISQHIVYNAGKIDCRDPSIFPVKKDNEGKVTLWGMVLSGANANKYWFLKSDNLLDWSFAGEFYYIYPECMTVSKVKTAENEEHYAIGVASRYYTVGDFAYDEVTGHINFILTDGRNIKDVPQGEAFKKMDFGEDSYAAQTFYIDDTNSEYYGKSISVNWFSGLPSDAESGPYAQVRKPWNGGGMTIPVEFGLSKVGNEYLLTQKPITVGNNKLERAELVNVSNATYNNTNDPLEEISSHLLELEADISNEQENSVEFKVNVGSDEYTSFGWTKSEGYFFDRTRTSRAGISFTKNYSHRFTTGPVDGKHLSFYVLIDNGSLEMFCGDYKYTFYNLTLAAPYSNGASLKTSGEITINSLKVQQISSIWHDISDLDKGVLYVNESDVKLDLTLGKSKVIPAYSSNDSEISWEIVSGEEFISLTKTKQGATVTAIANGEASVRVTSGEQSKTIKVIVDDGEVNCDYELKPEQIYCGDWLTTSKGLLATQNTGDGYLISDMVGNDFTYTATFDLSKAAAAGLLLRANKSMSSYIMANYDKNANTCKIWSPKGLIASGSVSGVDVSNVSLTAKTEDRNIELYLNGNLVASGKAKESDPLSGYYGLNVFSGEVTFKNVSVLKSEYTFANADLAVSCGTKQYIKAIYNVTYKNTLVDRNFYHVEEDQVIIHKEYFQLLEPNKLYSFFIEGASVSFNAKVDVGNIERVLTIGNREIKVGEPLNVFIGGFTLESITINGQAVDASLYEVQGSVVHVDPEAFVEGANTVVINGVSFSVTVSSILEDVSVPEPTPEIEPTPETTTDEEPAKKKGCGGSVIASSALLTITSLIGFVLITVKRKKGDK